jgi:hypothetical protein
MQLAVSEHNADMPQRTAGQASARDVGGYMPRTRWGATATTKLVM